MKNRKITMTNKTNELVTEIRELQVQDIDNGFLETLDSLKPGTRSLDKIEAKKMCKTLENNPNIRIFVALSGENVASTIGLVLEQKFINNFGIVCHIEDVATHKDFQHKGIGAILLEHVLNFAGEHGCYKTILNCEEEVVEFYEKGGMKIAINAKGNREFEMRYDHIKK